MAGRLKDSMRYNASGVRPGGEEMQAADASGGSGQLLVRGHPERTTGLSEKLICVSCGVNLIKNRKRLRTYTLSGSEINEEAYEYFQKLPSSSSRSLGPNDCVCHKCWQRFIRNRQSKNNENIEMQSIKESSKETKDFIRLDMSRASNTQSQCIFGCHSGRFRVSQQTRAQVLTDFRFYIPQDARVCSNHNNFHWTEIPQESGNIFAADQITDMVDLLRGRINTDRKHIINFDFFQDIDDVIVKHHTGLTKDQFEHLLAQLPTLSKTEKRHPETSLAIYLSKLRNGHTDDQLAHTFVNGSRHIAQDLLNKARDAIEKDFTITRLGFKNMNREKIADQRTILSRNLLLDENSSQSLITIWDCTYVYINKSRNNTFQRKSYSAHKQRPLVKPMIVVAPNGLILDVIGPFPATKNDAEILKTILNNMPEVISKFRRGDVFVVDRGFRDAVSYLQDKGFIVKMPELVQSGENQLNDLSANRSRIVTKIRYVVETIDGHLKTCFRYFDHVWHVKMLPHLMQDLRNAAAIHIEFYVRCISDVDDAQVISELMLSNVNQKNILGQIVKETNLNRKLKQFRSITDEVLTDFPVLSEKDIYLIALGRYQIKEAESYYGEHIASDGRFKIEICTNIDKVDFASYGLKLVNPLFIKGRIQSRHINKTKYYVYVLAEKNLAGYAKHHNGQINPPSEDLENIFIRFDSSDEEDAEK